MSTATISGAITFPAVSGGSNTSPVLGAPTVTPASANGPQLTYEEGGASTYKIPVGAPTSIPFGSLSAADILYVGADQEVQLVLNGGAEVITVAADGFILLYKAGITALTAEAVSVEANVVIVALGD